MTHRTKTILVAVAATLSFVITTDAAYATSITFNFNSPALSTSAPMTGANSVQSYMNGVLTTSGGGTVALSGTGLSAGSSIVTNSYDGEGHVIGPGGIPVTLGTTDNGIGHGAPNDNFLYTSTGSDIRMVFTGIAPISHISFDYEIFPDSQCSNVNTCGAGNIPDFTFLVDGQAQIHVLAVNPPAGSRSPASNPERNPQLGPLTFTYLFPSPVTSTTLVFKDWPATIGIDNVTLTSAPEPGTLILLGSGIAGLVARRRRSSSSRSTSERTV